MTRNGVTSWPAVAAGLLACALLGCTTSATTPCAEGLCEAGAVCVESAGLCASPTQLAACSSLDEGAPCEFEGVEGQCRVGVCLPAACGNGFLDPGEECDDGNNASGDGCRADCRSNERCGNGVVDRLEGEACDCGDGSASLPEGCRAPNGSGDDAECRSDCSLAGCGDGIVNGAEDCDGSVPDGVQCADFNFYRGEVTCGAQCRFDTSACDGFCGDGVIEANEACDGDAGSGLSCRDFAADFGPLSCTSACTVSASECRDYGGERSYTPLDGRSLVSMEPTTDGTIWVLAPPRDNAPDGTESAVYRVQLDPVTLEEAVTSPARLRDLAATPTGGLVAVGDAGTFLETEDGTTWSAGTLGTDVDLLGVTAVGTDIVVVGRRGFIARRDAVGSWSTRQVGDADLHAVLAIGDSVVLAGGDEGSLYRFDGSDWIRLELPVLGAAAPGLRALWGSSESNLYVGTDDGALLQYGGSTWRSVDELAGALDTIVQITGASPDRLWVSDGTRALFFDGRTWSQSDGAASVAEGANGRFSLTPSAIKHDEAPRIRTIYYVPILLPPDWRGQQWLDAWTGPNRVFFVAKDGYIGEKGASPELTVLQPLTEHDLHGVWGGADVTFAVGDAGTILARDTVGWSEVDAPGDADLRDIWGAPDGTFVAVGARGTTLHFDGVQWQRVESGTDRDLHAVWGRSGVEVYAAGDDGTVLRFDGARWTSLETGIRNDLRSLWAGQDTLFAGGVGGLMLRYEDGAWSSLATYQNDAVTSLCGIEDDNVAALTATGTVLHFDGTRWARIPDGTGAGRPAAVHCSERRFVFAEYIPWILDFTP